MPGKLHLKMKNAQWMLDLYEDIRITIGEAGALFIFIGLLFSTVVALTFVLEIFISLVLQR